MEKSFFDRNHPTIGYALGACLAETVTTPMYTIKTIYQTSDKSINCIMIEIYNKHGIFGFYNAVISAIFARFVSAFFKYLIYNEIKYYRQTSENDLINNMFNGCTTGIVSSFVVHPFDVLTTHLQSQLPLNRSIYHFDKLYSGFSQTLIRNFFLYSILFSVFDYAKYYTDNNIVLSCMITTSISTTILQPVDYLRTRLMAQQKVNIRNILFNFEKIKSCWRGYHLNYIANTTHFTIAMLISHQFSLYWKDLTK